MIPAASSTTRQEWRLFSLGFYAEASTSCLCHAMQIPHWLLALITASPSLWLTARALKERRARRNIKSPCPECGQTARKRRR